MIVRRFVSWLRGTLSASLRSMRRHAERQYAREPVLIGAPPRAESAEQTPPALTLINWLDNGRRLRPRLRLTPPPPREQDKRTTRPLRYRPMPTTQPPQTELAPQISLAPIAPAAPEQIEAIPDSSLIPALPTAVNMDEYSDEYGDDLDALAQFDGDTRRLMVLRHLVRQRVFNEGFASDSIPPQYRKSHGAEASPPRE
jgi:hypothetical protein